MERRPQLTYKFDLPGGEGRLREMVLYVCERCAEAKRFGKVKLNKILWRADFTAFAERGLPVTGRSYIKLAAGPAPAEMPPMLAEMESKGLIVFERRELSNDYVEERPRALVEPSLRLFSPDDLRFIDSAISFYWNKSATQASELSHRIMWRSRSFEDPIPYEAVYLSDEKLSEADKIRFADIARAGQYQSL